MISLLIALAVQAATPPSGWGSPAPPTTKAWATREQDVVLRNFRFRDGESLAELRMHVTTLGSPHRNAAGRIDNAVMSSTAPAATESSSCDRNLPTSCMGRVSRSTSANTGSSFPTISVTGSHRSPQTECTWAFPSTTMTTWSKRSTGCSTEGLGVTHLRLIFGTSMGCMHAFVWGETYPDFASALMPMACEPIEIAGLNRMWRQLAIDGIERDPVWRNGEYASEPVVGLRAAGDSLLRRRLGRRSITRRSIRRARPRALMPRSGSRPVWQKWTPTTRSISWTPRATTTRGRSWSGSRRQ